MSRKVVGTACGAGVLLFVFGFTAGRFSHPSKEETKAKIVATVADHKDEKDKVAVAVDQTKKFNAAPIHIHAVTKHYTGPKGCGVDVSTKDTFIGATQSVSETKKNSVATDAIISDHKALNLEEHSKTVSYQPKYLYTFRAGTNIFLDAKEGSIAVERNVFNMFYVGPYVAAHNIPAKTAFTFGLSLTIPH